MKKLEKIKEQILAIIQKKVKPGLNWKYYPESNRTIWTFTVSAGLTSVMSMPLSADETIYPSWKLYGKHKLPWLF